MDDDGQYTVDKVRHGGHGTKAHPCEIIVPGVECGDDWMPRKGCPKAMLTGTSAADLSDGNVVGVLAQRGKNGPFVIKSDGLIEGYLQRPVDAEFNWILYGHDF